MAWKALSTHLQELRVHLCQTGQGSQGVRDFIMSTYAKIKTDNPRFPFLIREAEGVKAKLIARYDFGVEKSVVVEGKDKSGVEAALKSLMQDGGK